jgi:hypothetical protein
MKRVINQEDIISQTSKKKVTKIMKQKQDRRNLKVCQKKPRYWGKKTQTWVQRKKVKLKESMEVKQGWDQARATRSRTDSVDQIVDRGVGCWAHCWKNHRRYWAVCLARNWYVAV